MLSILITLLIISFIGQVLYQFYFFGRLSTHIKQIKSKTTATRIPSAVKNAEGLSLIICAKNELDNLQKHLPIWANQKNVKYSLIIINDDSTDGTAAFLNKQVESYKHLSVKHLRHTGKGKRTALAHAIALAQYPKLIFTDADCSPSNLHWLATLNEYFYLPPVYAKGRKTTDSTEIILGYSPYYRRSGLLNLCIQYETILTAANYLGYALAGMPYMGVGRNLAYTKSIYTHAGGIQTIAQTQTGGGDDDLLVAKMATKRNTSICIDKKSFTYSAPPATFKEWYKQKQRHISASTFYNKRTKILLGIYPFFHILFFGTLIAVLLLYNIKWVIILFIIKILLQQLAFFSILQQFNRLYLIPFIPVLDILWILYYFIFLPYTFNKKAKTPKASSWK